ncbi:MAG: hypothetical protein MHM6MM_007644 [Cercozoa sp. M6MM]
MGTRSSAHWRRVLWLQQPFEDNYTDASFLSLMVRNANVRPRAYTTLALSTAPVAQHASAVLSFLAVFDLVNGGRIDSRGLLVLDAILLGLGMIVHRICAYHENVAAICRRIVVLLALLLALSPVLQTLTVAYSGDTVWALTLILLGINVFGHDFSAPAPTEDKEKTNMNVRNLTVRNLTAEENSNNSGNNNNVAMNGEEVVPGADALLPVSLEDSLPDDTDSVPQEKKKGSPPHVSPFFGGTLSLNAGILASVLLASRLSSPMLVFAFILLAFQVFAGAPIVRQMLRKKSRRMARVATLVACTASQLALIYGGARPVLCVGTFAVLC